MSDQKNVLRPLPMRTKEFFCSVGRCLFVIFQRKDLWLFDWVRCSACCEENQ